MKYSECFFSIQGEGKLMGMPSVFFRTSYCNLRCHFCDTPYTSWRPENKDITVKEAVSMIEEYGAKHVVITGGEPFMFKKELEDLCVGLQYGMHHITIETNATIFHEVKADLISMSPKLESSTPYEQDPNWAEKHNRERIKLDVIDQFIDYCDYSAGRRDYQLKFVVTDGNELEEIQDLISDLGCIDPSSVLLMPEGRTAKEIQEKQVWLAELCMAHGYRYSDRMHTRFWNDKRGV